tara:strand:+ start:247 stop:711 length:465 start_codon:yes stop_codon:yes gene_type:complete
MIEDYIDDLENKLKENSLSKEEKIITKIYEEYQLKTKKILSSKTFKENDEMIMNYAYESMRDIVVFHTIHRIASRENLSKMQVIKRYARDRNEDVKEILRDTMNGEILINQIVMPCLIEHWTTLVGSGIDTSSENSERMDREIEDKLDEMIEED